MNMQEFSWTYVGLFFWKDICHTHEEFEYNDHNIHDTTKAEELLGHLCVLLGLAIFFLIFRPKYHSNMVYIELLRKKKKKCSFKFRFQVKLAINLDRTTEHQSNLE